jgi:nitrogen fixation/metabolism regulation signal transduction histidine kinase
MKIKTKFILFISIIHIILLILSFEILDFEEKRFLFLVAECLIIISIIISFKMYKSFIRPLEMISLGVESIKAKDFNTSFVKVGQSELDQLIELYNTMILELRNERKQQQEQHYFLSNLIEASPLGIIILDFDNKISEINPAALSLFKKSKSYFSLKNIELISIDLIQKINCIKDTEAHIISSNEGKKFRCQKSSFIDRGFQHSFILIEEITKELVKTEKNSYEKIIRVMSHEVNNTIGSINSILNSFKTYSNSLEVNDKINKMM